MSPSRTARRSRVERVVAAGRRIADPTDPLGAEARARLMQSSGLSEQGIELALAHHLETRPSSEDLDALLDAAGTAPRCHVVLSANVCTAALRAIAVAVATAPSVSIRASRRDPVMASLVAYALSVDDAFAAAGGEVVCVAAIDAEPGDELHVYGTDETVAHLTASARAGVVVRGHGAGLGIVVVGEADAIDDAAAGVAADVVPFDQRGCLSPRAVLVEGGVERAETFARALSRALGELGARIPRGPLDDATRAELALYRASIQAVGDLLEGPDHAVGFDPSPRALVLAPAARIVHVVPADAGDAAALLETWARHVTSIGTSRNGALARAVEAVAPSARRAIFGQMQHPPLDGPVDLRRRDGRPDGTHEHA